MVNAEMPGPTITVTKGQHIQVLVRNMLPSSTKPDPRVTQYGGGNTNMVTIHYHGIRQYKSNQADGVPFLTQDPIPPGGHFLHDFVVDTAGTYFYHAHVGLQECSVFGAIVVYDSEKADPGIVYRDYNRHPRSSEKIESSTTKYHHSEQRLLTVDGTNGSPDLTYHDDRVIVLSEWFHQDRHDMESYFLGPTFTAIEEAESVLINGQTINNQSNIMATDTHPCKGYSVINVKQGKTYRIRVIGAATFRSFGFAIAGHRLRIIEADGGLVEPYETDNLEVSPGQRYSVLVKMDQPVGDYAIGTIRVWATGVDPTSNGWAVLRYNDKDDISEYYDAGDAHQSIPVMTLPQAQPKLPDENIPYWIWDKLKPLGGRPDPISLLPRPHRTIYLETHNGPLTNLPGSERFFINNVTFLEPSFTLLSQVLNGSRVQSPLSTQDLEHDDRRGYDPYLGTYPLAYMEVVDFVIQNTYTPGIPCRSHPWHTHGFSHYLIAQGPGTYDEALHGGIRNITFPILRDTTLVYPDTGLGFASRTSSENAVLGCGWSKIRLIAVSKIKGKFNHIVVIFSIILIHTHSLSLSLSLSLLGQSRHLGYALSQHTTYAYGNDDYFGSKHKYDLGLYCVV
ncbi:unnamed protein product [Absidia cylindrospora]